MLNGGRKGLLKVNFRNVIQIYKDTYGLSCKALPVIGSSQGFFLKHYIWDGFWGWVPPCQNFLQFKVSKCCLQAVLKQVNKAFQWKNTFFHHLECFLFEIHSFFMAI